MYEVALKHILPLQFDVVVMSMFVTLDSKLSMHWIVGEQGCQWPRVTAAWSRKGTYY